VDQVNASVVLLGGLGTGKELAAKRPVLSVKLSKRHKPGFVTGLVVCGITETLVESELFGHTKGAFTGRDLLASKLSPTPLMERRFISRELCGYCPCRLQENFYASIENRNLPSSGKC